MISVPCFLLFMAIAALVILNWRSYRPYLNVVPRWVLFWPAYLACLGMIVARQFGVAASRGLSRSSRLGMERRIASFSRFAGVLAYFPFILLSLGLIVDIVLWTGWY